MRLTQLLRPMASLPSQLRLPLRVGQQRVGRVLNLSSSASLEGADVGGSYESWRKPWLQPAIIVSLGTAALVAVAWYVEILGLPAQVKQLEKNIDIKLNALSASTNAKIESTNAKIDALSASTNAKIDALSSKFDSLNDFKIQLLIRMDKSETRAEKRWF